MNIAQNYIFYLIYQITLIILPFVTIPYVTRVLGSDGVGSVAFTDSVVQIFLLFGSLGIALYGNRSIAYNKDNPEERSRVFWEIFFFRLLTMGIMIIIYLIFVFYFSPAKFRLLYLVYLSSFLTQTFSIAWMLVGLGDVQKWVSRNFVVKIIAVILTFVLVKKPSDVWIYAFIYSFTEFICSMILWMYVPRYIKPVKVHFKNILKHWTPVLTLFIPQIAVSIYFVMDKTLLGILSSTSEVGYYDMAMKIIKLSVTIVTSMSFVVQPKISSIYAQGDFDQIKSYTYKTFDFASFLSIPISVGILAVAPELVQWFFGDGFLKVTTLLIIISLIAVPMAWSSVLGQQLMIAMNQEKKYSYSVICGAVSNAALNFLLIPSLKSTGACVAMLVAQFFVVGVQFYLMRNFLNYKNLFMDFWKYSTASLIFFVVIRILGFFMGSGILTTLIQVITGMILYVVILSILKSQMLDTILSKVYAGYAKIIKSLQGNSN